MQLGFSVDMLVLFAIPARNAFLQNGWSKARLYDEGKSDARKRVCIRSSFTGTFRDGGPARQSPQAVRRQKGDLP